MKIYISCESPILQKTLDLYLKDYIADYNNCDFVISDNICNDINKPICLATLRGDSDISRPMHRESLFKDLSIFYNNLNRETKDSMDNILDINELANLRNSIDSINKLKNENNANDPLKEQLDSIFQDFANKIYNVIKNNNE